MKINSLLLFCVLMISAVPCAKAQHATDTTLRKNTIKLDITSRWLYRNALVFSYERVVKTNQSWAVSIGLQELPISTHVDSIRAARNLKSAGYKIGGEYRFYLKKENKYGAPHGVYIGPYFTYLNFNNKRNFEVMTNGAPEYVDLSSRIDVVNLGFQIGYQFVLNDRWTIDLIFIGPSFSNYRASMKLDGNYSFDPSDIQNQVIQALVDRFPGFCDLIQNQDVSSSGKVNTWGYGYRYQFLVGYHFGRKKK